ncbi:MAG: TonB-dependent receptor [Bacteroidales bacterium]|nr:TonB-dependent receptor [Bacteroidales bacterium]
MKNENRNFLKWILKTIFLYVFLTFIGTTGLNAQEREITGTVTTLTGESLPGVTVIIKDTQTGKITGLDGKYTIDAPDANSVLVFSFVGYVTQEISINNRSIVDVILEESTEALDEVVVIGYGTQKKINLTGSVEQIKGTTLVSQPVFQVSQALTGTVSGVTVVQNSGQPGKDIGTIRIRGLGSLGSGAKNEPLVLIDGVQGDINGIDPGDIENMSILKDAAASAIYGSRAANGVILITTKRAKKGEISVSYNNYLGWQTVTDKPKYLGALDFLENDGNSTQEFIDDYRANLGTDPDRYPDTDWVDELFSESGFMQYHKLSVTGGNDNIIVAASISCQDQDGNIPNFNFKRYNGRFNSDIRVSEKIGLNFDLNFRQSLAKEPSQSMSLLTQQAFRIPPIYVARHTDGSWGDGWGGRNPVPASQVGGLNQAEDNYFQSILKLNYNPVKGLNVSLMYSPQYQNVFNQEFTKTYETIVDWDQKTTRTVPDRSSLSQGYTRLFTNNLNAIVSYGVDFSDHSLLGLAGYEMIKNSWEQFGAYRDQFVLQDYQVLNAGSEENASNNGSASRNSLVSYFGRVNYSYMNKYLFEANVRRDASSRFAPENRISTFPSFSVGWRIAEEDFFQSIGFCNDLKLRASWGQLGNQQIGSDFPYVSSIAIGSSNHVFGNSILTGGTQNVMANPDIQWETTETSNFGLDAGFLDNRLTFTAEYYIRKTNDILLQIPIPLSVGLSPATRNAANVENVGWDLTMRWKNNINDFTYSVGVIASDFTNEVTNLADVGPIISGNYIIQVGSPINSIFGYETQGIFQTQTEIDEAPAQFGTLIPGNVRYKDQLTVDTNGDGIPDEADGFINPDDRVIIGNPFPKMSYAFDFSAQYKGFDLSVVFQGVGKRDVLLQGDAVWALFNAGKIQEWHIEESWTSENTDASFPIISPTSSGSNDILPSSTWVFNAAYLRLRNVNFGYSIPNLPDKIFISSLRLYFSGQNLFTFDNMPDGIDPLVPNGTSGGFYPIVSSYTFGIDVKF